MLASASFWCLFCFPLRPWAAYDVDLQRLDEQTWNMRTLCTKVGKVRETPSPNVRTSRKSKGVKCLYTNIQKWDIPEPTSWWIILGPTAIEQKKVKADSSQRVNMWDRILQDWIGWHMLAFSFSCSQKTLFPCGGAILSHVVPWFGTWHVALMIWEFCLHEHGRFWLPSIEHSQW